MMNFPGYLISQHATQIRGYSSRVKQRSIGRHIVVETKGDILKTCPNPLRYRLAPFPLLKCLCMYPTEHEPTLPTGNHHPRF